MVHCNKLQETYNKAKGDKFLLPQINELLDNLIRFNYFSTTDLVYSIKRNRQRRHFKKQLSLPQNHAANLFECRTGVMLSVLRRLYSICHIYMDDILSHSTSLHVEWRKKILTPRNSNLKIQLDKFELKKKTFHF